MPVAGASAGFAPEVQMEALVAEHHQPPHGSPRNVRGKAGVRAGKKTEVPEPPEKRENTLAHLLGKFRQTFELSADSRLRYRQSLVLLANTTVRDELAAS